MSDQVDLYRARAQVPEWDGWQWFGRWPWNEWPDTARSWLFVALLEKCESKEALRYEFDADHGRFVVRHSGGAEFWADRNNSTESKTTAMLDALDRARFGKP